MKKVPFVAIVVLILFLYIKDNFLADEIKVFGINLTLLVLILYLGFFIASYIFLSIRNTKLERSLRESEISVKISSDHVADEGEKDC